MPRTWRPSPVLSRVLLPDTIPQILRQSARDFFPQITQIYAEMIAIMTLPDAVLKDAENLSNRPIC
jgi:hypothetical protein